MGPLYVVEHREHLFSTQKMFSSRGIKEPLSFFSTEPLGTLIKQPQFWIEELICRCSNCPLHLPLMSARFQILAADQLVCQHVIFW